MKTDTWEKLDRIQVTLGVADDVMAELMRLTRADFVQMRARRQEPVFRSVIGLADQLNLSFESFIEGRIDYGVMERQFRGDAAGLPEMYQDDAFGRMRIASDYIRRVEGVFGWRRRAALMKKLQLKEATIADPDNPINIKLTTDIMSWVNAQPGGGQALFQMGFGIVKSQLGSNLHPELAVARDLGELYVILFESFIPKYWERNFLWRIQRIDALRIRIQGRPNPDLLGKVGDFYVRNVANCHVRHGIIAAFPTLMGYPVGKVGKSRCVARSDEFCEFELDLSALQGHRRLRAVN